MMLLSRLNTTAHLASYFALPNFPLEGQLSPALRRGAVDEGHPFLHVLAKKPAASQAAKNNWGFWWRV